MPIPARALLRAAVPLVLTLQPAMAWAEEPPVAELPPVVVEAQAEPPPPRRDAASEHHATAEQLRARTYSRTGEFLEFAPGLIVAQHSGEGKANQYFLRGFNLDHGTDLAIFVDGMPVNMRTHAHGQGYADTNFVIPELVAGMQVRKGPFFADEGDFATAGSLRLALINRLEANFGQVTYGSFGYARAVGAASAPMGNGHVIAGLEIAGYNGPWERPDELRRLNGVIRYAEGTPTDGFSMTGMAYAGRWYATDQVALRAINEGIIGRYGTLNPTDGGSAQRYSLSGQWARTGDYGTTRINAYAIRSTLSLFSDFTYWLNDPVNGDQFQQRDRRWVTGGAIRHSVPTTTFGHESEFRVGLELRRDDIRLGLLNTTARTVTSMVRLDAVQQSSAGLFAEVMTRWSPWLRTTIGARLDWMGGQVASSNPLNSGTASQAMVNPKLGMVLGPWWQTEFFFNLGGGFHSNDIRGATLTVAPTDPLVLLSRSPLLARAQGAEIGIRTRAIPNLETAFAAFYISMASEIVFVGDAGTTELGPGSRRFGVEWTNHWQPRPWLTFDLDASLTQARFVEATNGGRYIPGAPAFVGAAGVTLGESVGWFGTARMRIIGWRPLTEDNSVRQNPTFVGNSRIGYRFANGIRAQLESFNLFGSRGSQVEYYYVSRLQGEPPAGVADRHLHPMEPFAARITLAAEF